MELSDILNNFNPIMEGDKGNKIKDKQKKTECSCQRTTKIRN